jgi:hypothetical protein
VGSLQVATIATGQWAYHARYPGALLPFLKYCFQTWNNYSLLSTAWQPTVDDERYCRRYHPAPSALWPRTGLPASRQASHHNHGSVQASVQDGAVGQVPRAADIRQRQEGIIQKQGHGLPPGPPEETTAVTGQFDRLRAAGGCPRLPRLHPNPHPHPLRSTSELRGEVTRTSRRAPGHSVWRTPPSLRHATNVFRL